MEYKKNNSNKSFVSSLNMVVFIIIICLVMLIGFIIFDSSFMSIDSMKKIKDLMVGNPKTFSTLSNNILNRHYPTSQI
jgi:hypothetical protein